MKKILSLCLALLMLASCIQAEVEEEITEEIPQTEETVVEEPEEEPQLQWTENIPAVSYEIDWSVETSSEETLLELTSEKYQGRVTGSAGNCLAADYIESRFAELGLQTMPEWESYRQSFDSVVYEVLPGSAAVVAADGSETELELGVDWVFKPSYEAADLTLPLSANLSDCEAGKAFWDANQAEQESPRKYIEVISGDIEDYRGYINSNGAASQVLVTEEIYQQLSQNGAKLHLELPAAVQEGTAENIIGYLPGADSTKAVIIGASFDGYGQCGVLLPSAYNNASGTAALIQTAAWLAQADELPCDVIFAAFNGECDGQSGSQDFSAYVDDLYEQILMINLKCIGWTGEELTVYSESQNSALRNDLAGGLNLRYKEKSFGGDDMNFRKKNMMAVSIFQDACLEKVEVRTVLSKSIDTADNLDSAMLDELAKALSAWVIERGGDALSQFIPVVW